MKLKIAAIFIILLAALMLLAQDTAQIFSEIQQAGPAVAPIVEPAATPAVVEVAPVVTMPVVEPARREPPVEPVEPTPVVVEAAPVVTTPVEPARREPPVEPAPVVVEAAPVVKTAAAAPEDVVETVVVSAEPATGGTIKAGLISVSLKDVELSNVIRLFATLSDANIIVPELEAGAGSVKVDVNLKEVEWKPALQSILETQNFELYEKTPGTAVYSVRKKLSDAPALLNVKTFKLNYATVAGVSEMIKTLIPPPGKISIFPARNTIVVQSTLENMADIQAIIASIDLPRQQVFVEAKIMELSDGASEKIGIDWQMLGDDNGGFAFGLKNIIGGISQTNTTTESRFEDISGRTYEQVTSPVDWGVRSGSNPNTDERISGITPTVQSVDLTTKALGATLNADDFRLVLAALKEINGAKIVSNPKIIVANEEPAQIYIGSKEPNIKQSTTQAQNADAVTTYNLDTEKPFFEYGIKLDVTPTINTSSNITVVIAPTLSRKLSDKSVGDGGAGNTFPVTSEKTIKTIFSLASGQTAAIGGLSEATADDIERKIPILGNLPLIGRFFSYSSKEKNQTETVIFVTVGLANPDNINMETGLPQDSTLAMRHEAKARANRQIEAEELRVLNQNEDERAQSVVQKLQNAEKKRLEKKNK